LGLLGTVCAAVLVVVGLNATFAGAFAIGVLLGLGLGLMEPLSGPRALCLLSNKCEQRGHHRIIIHPHAHDGLVVPKS